MRSFAVVCEAKSDHLTATGLADLVFIQELPATAESLTQIRVWRGLNDQVPFTWTQASFVTKNLGRKVQGKFSGEVGELGAREARKILYLLMEQTEKPDAVFLIRDDDGCNRAGYAQARDAYEWPFKVVIGLANLEREAWVLAGFVPKNERENRLWDALKIELSFCPITKAERLTHKGDTDLRSPKRVLKKLTQDNEERECECWTRGDLNQLETNGRNTGLLEYIQEVRERIIPLLRNQ